VQGDIAAIDRGFHRSDIVLNASAGTQELLVDIPDMEAAGVIGFQPVGYLEQLFDRGADLGERALFPEFHRTRRMVMPPSR
jgi:hypothetical protein